MQRCVRGEGTTPVRPGQIWKTALLPKRAWRPVQVIQVVGDQVELEYLDLPGVPNLQKTFTVSANDIRDDRRRFRAPR
jgi:hypothetical protein